MTRRAMSAWHFIKVDIKYSVTTDTAASTGITISPTRRVYDLVDPALTFKSFNILVRRWKLKR